jgi:tetratricopeptide (TPR) repeat protein
MNKEQYALFNRIPEVWMKHDNVSETPDYQQILAERLKEPETAKHLVQLLDKLDTIDAVISGMEEFMRKAPEMLLSIQQESQHALKIKEAGVLLDKISQPDVMRSLGNLIDKAETLEVAVSALELITEKAPEIAGSIENESGKGLMMSEVLRLIEEVSEPDVIRNLNEILSNLDTIAMLTSALGEAERKFPELIASMHQESEMGKTIHQYLTLLQKLSNDKVINNLNNLIDKIENLDAVLNILDEVVRNNPELKEPSSTTIQNINELFELLTKSMKEEEATILETARGGISILAEVNRILLSPKTEVIIKGMTSALEYDRNEIPEIGPIGFIRMIRDKNTRKSLGLISILGHEIGRHLEDLDVKAIQEFEQKHRKSES